jgi:hypothetical protein
MKSIGALVLVVGIIWALVAFQMKTTVSTESQDFGSGTYAMHIPSITVQNIGLLEDRRNQLMFSGLSILAGILLIGFGSKAKSDETDLKACPVCAEGIQPTALKCRYCNSELPDSFRPNQEELSAEASRDASFSKVLVLIVIVSLSALGALFLASSK